MNERYTFVLRSASPLVMLHLKDQDACGRDFDDGESIFCDLLDDIAPAPDCLVMLFKSYFDESYDKDLLCVAGYVFTSRNARKLDVKWRKMLALKRLPYFRMSACNSRQPPFDKLSEHQCIDIASSAIDLIGEYAICGHAVTVDQKLFCEIVRSNGFMSSPYEFYAWMCLVGSNLQTDKLVASGSKYAFIFEAGFRHQGQANKMMHNIFSSPNLRDKYKYKSHAFVDKADARPTQASDLLAWQWYKDHKRRSSGRNNPRGDLQCLIAKIPHYTLHADAEKLRYMVDRLAELVGNPFGSQIVGEAIRNPSSPIFKRRPIEQWAGLAFEAFAKRVGNASGDLW